MGSPEHPHPLQQAFIDAGAIQCGFCTPGMIMAAKALLDCNPRPSREEVASSGIRQPRYPGTFSASETSILSTLARE